MNILEFKRKLLGHTFRDDGGGDGGGGDGTGGGSAAGTAARNGMGFGGTGSGVGGEGPVGSGGNKPGEGPLGGYGYGYHDASFNGSEAAANPKPGEDKMAQAGAVTSGMSTMSAAEQAERTGQSFSSLTGLKDGEYLSREQLNSLKAAGYGDMEGANPANQTQSVNEQIAAHQVSNFLGFMAKVAESAIPGLGLAKAGFNIYSGLRDGTISTESGLKDVASIALGMKTGISSDAIGQALNGNISGAVQTGIADKATGLLGKAIATSVGDATGIGARAANAFGQASGLNTSMRDTAREAVGGLVNGRSGSSSSSTGGSPNASGEVRATVNKAADDINKNADLNNSIPAFGRGF